LNSFSPTIENGDGVLPVIACCFDVFIQNDGLLFLARSAVASLELLEVRTIPLAHEKAPFG
jgi:hypothetical protein